MSQRHRVGGLAAAIVLSALAGFAAASPAYAANILDSLKLKGAAPATAGVTPGLVLPAISNPRPYRNGLQVTCNRTSAIGSNLCVMNFGKVAAGHVLQINKISCIVNQGTAILFNSQLVVDGAHVFGFVLPPFNSGGTGGQGSGPFYFNAGEKPILLGQATTPTDTAICSIFGTMWQTP
jgi:hypothetical protein